MKKIPSIIIAVLIAVATVFPATAQFRWGPRIGTEVGSMRFDKSVFNNENRAGFTGGLTAEIGIPVVGICFDASLMYVHRVSHSEAKINTGATTGDNDVLGSSTFRNRDYFEIPINLKYKIGLPVVGKIITPYLLTGPTFSVLASKRDINSAFRNRRFSTAWNIGAGVELFSHLQVSASYGIGMNRMIESTGNTAVAGSDLDSKSNYWTITAAWLF